MFLGSSSLLSEGFWSSRADKKSLTFGEVFLIFVVVAKIETQGKEGHGD